MCCLAQDKWESIHSSDAFDSEKKVKVVAECAHFAGRGGRTENRGAEVKRPSKWRLALCLHQTQKVQGCGDVGRIAKPGIPIDEQSVAQKLAQGAAMVLNHAPAFGKPGADHSR